MLVLIPVSLCAHTIFNSQTDLISGVNLILVVSSTLTVHEISKYIFENNNS